MYKKLDSYVYIWLTSISGCSRRLWQDTLYKDEKWSDLSHQQYLSAHLVWDICLWVFKGADNSYFMHYFCVVIMLVNTSNAGLQFLQFLVFLQFQKKLVFCLSVLSVLFVLNEIFWIKTLLKRFRNRVT